MSKINIAFRLCAGLFTLALALSLAGPVRAECTDALGCVTVGPTDEIHIAYILAMTGGAGDLGVDQERGIQLAIEDAGGAILGHDISLSGEDDGCTFEGGETAGQTLDDDPTIIAVIGTSCSSAAAGAMPYLSAAGFSMVSPSNTRHSLTEPGSLDHYDGYLRVSWDDAIQGETAAQYAYNILGLTTAATMKDGSEYTDATVDAFEAEFTALGGTLSAQVTIDPGDQTVIDTKLGDIATADPSVGLIYYPGLDVNAIVYIIDQKATAGLGSAYLMGSDGSWTPDINNATDEEGYLLTNYDFTATRNSYYVTDFLPAYVTNYGDPIAPFHAHAYDAFMIIKAAIEAAAVEVSPGTHEIGRQALRDALYATTNHAGLTGNLTCDANGDCADPRVAVYQFHEDVFPPEYLAPDKVGLITDGGGIADMGFNYAAYQGVLKAEQDFGIGKTLYQPADDTQYEAELQQCADDGNGLCIAVGFSMNDAVNNVANANPNTHFAIVDMPQDSPPANLRGLVFNEKQVGYLAGALAAKMSPTNVIGAVGGMNIPPVVRFMEGYRNGAKCAKPGMNVLLTYTGTFTDPDLGADTAAAMIAQGAGVIFNVAGPTGNGAILYSAQNEVWSIGVDTDQYVTLFENGSVEGADKLLTSAMKNLDVAVYDTIQDHLTDTFTSGTVTYDLAVDGVGLAPFHEADPEIPAATKAYLASVKQGIINGTIKVDKTCELFIGRSAAAQDGWILEAAENSNTGGTKNNTASILNLGDNAARKQYRSILSFNTAPLPDNASITKVTLRVKRQGVTGGGNPVTIFKGFMVDIKKGTFGTSALQLTDFNAAPNKTYGPFNTALSGGWYSINLTNGKAYVNKWATNSGLTQIRLRFKLDDNNNNIANILKLYSGNAGAASRPQLIVEYNYVP